MPQTGEPHLLLYYSYQLVNYWYNYTIQGLDIDLGTGQPKTFNGGLGVLGPNGTVLHSNGKIYTGGNDGPQGIGSFIVYDPATGQSQQLASLADKMRPIRH